MCVCVCVCVCVRARVWSWGLKCRGKIFLSFFFFFQYWILNSVPITLSHSTSFFVIFFFKTGPHLSGLVSNCNLPAYSEPNMSDHGLEHRLKLLWMTCPTIGRGYMSFISHRIKDFNKPIDLPIILVRSSGGHLVGSGTMDTGPEHSWSQ
jgi:hypothetical protein